MKMVKKILFTIAVVAFLTASVQAVDPGVYQKKYDGMWPYEYIAIPVCTIPILIDIGYFVQLEACGDYKIKLVQVPCGDIGKSATGDFPCYLDCETIKVRANFEVKLGGNIVNKASIWGDGSVYYSSIDSDVYPDIVPGDGAWYTRKVCVTAWDIKIWNAGGQGDEMQLAQLEITAKPTQTPSW
ncbi:MAG: hypothetical protein WAV28_00185 [Sedimentisphaerales bacterium]|jgi:hypothetical protein